MAITLPPKNVRVAPLGVPPVAARGPSSASVDAVSRLLTPKEAAEFLQVTEATLERWRTGGDGPRFAKLSGRVVRYSEADLRAFVESRMMISTAQATR
ncbi:MAG: helix-turn-helix domain-containing protein [Alphaproteobacteria bacterium]